MVRRSLADRRTAWRGTAAGLVAGLAVSGLFVAHIFDGPRDFLQDRLFPAPPPNPAITLVAADQTSLATLGYTWPPSNSVHARVIANLAAQHPRALVIDIVFDHLTYLDHDEARTDSDKALADALAQAARSTHVVIACEPDDQVAPMFQVPGVVIADRSLGQADSANTIRGVPIRPHPGCGNGTGDAEFLEGLRAAEGDTGTTAVSVGVAGLGSHRIPVYGSQDQMLIDFSNGGSPTCKYLAAYNNSCASSQVTGRIVVVGLKVLYADDLHAQAVSFAHDPSFCPSAEPVCMAPNQNYGYRIMADELGTVLGNRYLRLQPDSSVLLAALLIAALVGTALYLTGLLAGLVWTGIALGLYVLALVVLSRAGYLGDPLYGPLAIVLGAVAALVARYLLEERERRKVEGIFGQYVDPAVMRELVTAAGADQLSTSGARRMLTVLFTDVRGFTGLSERLAPEEVVGLLNDFTERTTRIVFEHGGTVDKYIGDSVMAFWNAPNAVPDHADRALAAALEIAGSGAVALGRRGIGVGVGLCSGDVVVGSIGGSARKDYTAIGDAVNVASRLCGLAPAGTVLVAEGSWELLSRRPDAELLQPVKVKGRSGPVKVRSITVDVGPVSKG